MYMWLKCVYTFFILIPIPSFLLLLNIKHFCWLLFLNLCLLCSSAIWKFTCGYVCSYTSVCISNLVTAVSLMLCVHARQFETHSVAWPLANWTYTLIFRKLYTAFITSNSRWQVLYPSNHHPSTPHIWTFMKSLAIWKCSDSCIKALTPKDIMHMQFWTAWDYVGLCAARLFNTDMLT